MRLTDMHTHTSFSPDAVSAPEEMCEKARQNGIYKLAVTDHCDCNFWLPENEHTYPQYQQKDKMMFGARDYAAASIHRISQLKEKYPFLLCGIELAQQLTCPDYAAQILAMEELDFVIGSLHMNDGCPDFYWLDYGNMKKGEIYHLLDDYFASLLDCCRRGNFDVLGHLTYPLRYIVGEHGIELDMGRYYEVILEIFTALIDGGRGIEINTSGLRQKYSKTLPDKEYVKLYKQCGGEILTVGSDAHKAADIGAGIADGIEIARECGFRYIAYFERRSAKFIKI